MTWLTLADLRDTSAPDTWFALGMELREAVERGLGVREFKPSPSSLLAINLVAAGLRPAARIVVPATHLRQLSVVAGRSGVRVLPGVFLLRESVVDPSFSYSDEATAESAARLGTASRCFAYLAQSREAAARAATAELNGSVRGFGEALGYPPCCISAWDAVEPAALGPSRRPWLLNVSLLPWDIELVPHTPCSPGCRASLRVAERIADHLKLTAPRQFRRLRRALSHPVLTFDDGSRLVLVDAAVKSEQLTLRPAVAQAFGTSARRVRGDLMKMGQRVELSWAQSEVLANGQAGTTERFQARVALHVDAEVPR